MRNLRAIVTLLISGCTPASPSGTKVPHEVNTTPSSSTPGVAMSSATIATTLPAQLTKASPSITAGADPHPAQAIATTLPITTLPSLAPPQTPPLERLTYHALPQRQLAFYAVLTPPNYDAPENVGRRYPLVVILHGSGSNELIHGSLGDDFGRDDVIYVLPRAPHPSPELFAIGKQGFSAWPVYPTPWGPYGSSTFPTAAIDRLQVHKYYTRWIAETVLDARARYRISHNRAVVVGHSQGALFAHLFAADYPALVRAYAAYAGPSEFVLNSSDAPRQFAALRSAAIVPLLIHHEADTIVDVSNTRALDAMMTQHGVKHVTHILPGGTHATDPQVRRLLRAFTREQCCGKERTTADIPVTADGKLSVPPMADTLTFGPGTCDAQVSAFTPCENKDASTPARCVVYEAEPCGRRSFGYRSLTFECVNAVWTQIAKSPAECGVLRRDPKLSSCNVQLMRTRPSEQSATDQCDLVFRCNGIQSVVTCDGNDDGSSACQCTRDGSWVSLPQNDYPHEAPLSCVAAAEQCAAR